MRLFRISAPVATTAVLALCAAAPLSAQWRPVSLQPPAESAAPVAERPVLRLDSPRPQPADDLSLVAAGIAGAALGSFGGAYLGYQLDREHFHWENGDDPGLIGMLGGWFVGSAMLTPMAVHLANGGRGSLPAAYLSSALIAGAGAGMALGAGFPEGVFFLLGTPLVQVASAVVFERDAER